MALQITTLQDVFKKAGSKDLKKLAPEEETTKEESIVEPAAPQPTAEAETAEVATIEVSAQAEPPTNKKKKGKKHQKAQHKKHRKDRSAQPIEIHIHVHLP